MNRVCIVQEPSRLRENAEESVLQQIDRKPVTVIYHAILRAGSQGHRACDEDLLLSQRLLSRRVESHPMSCADEEEQQHDNATYPLAGASR